MSIRRLRVVTSLALSIGLAGGMLASPAAAGDEGDPRPIGWSEKAPQQVVDKEALAAAWLAMTESPVVKSLGFSRPGAANASASLVRAHELLASEYARRYGEVPAASIDAVRVASLEGGIAAAPAPSRPPADAASLGLISVGQFNWFYCGPASGVTILNYKGLKNASKHPDASKNPSRHRAANSDAWQKVMAGSLYMNTDANEKTSFWSSNYNDGLNLWRSGKKSGFYVKSTLAGSSGRSKFSTAFLYNITAREPFAVSTLEKRDGIRYNGYSNPRHASGRGHWITGYGYSGYDSGSMKAKFADPMWSLEKGNVDPHFSQAMNQFYNRHVDERGIVW